MPVTAVIGVQWGDEAKGKIVDYLSDTYEIVAQFNGGDNAGHTVINPHGTFKLRLVPNGFSVPGASCVIGPGVVLNLKTLLDEIRLHTIRRHRFASPFVGVSALPCGHALPSADRGNL